MWKQIMFIKDGLAVLFIAILLIGTYIAYRAYKEGLLDARNHKDYHVGNIHYIEINHTVLNYTADSLDYIERTDTTGGNPCDTTNILKP